MICTHMQVAPALIHTSAHIYTNTLTHQHAHTLTLSHTHEYPDTNAHTHTHSPTPINTHAHSLGHPYTNTNKHAHIYTNARTHTPSTHTHTLTHTHTHSSLNLDCFGGFAFPRELVCWSYCWPRAPLTHSGKWEWAQLRDVKKQSQSNVKKFAFEGKGRGRLLN